MAGGYTIKLPTEERRLKTKAQFLADLAVAMGGYAAETVKFGDITTGSSNDIRQATDLAHRLVTQFGMSDKLGPRAFGKTQDLIFLGRELSTEKDYSEKTAADIDKEVDNLLRRAMKMAKDILSKNTKLLSGVAKALVEKEALEHDDFYKIIKKYKLKMVSV